MGKRYDHIVVGSGITGLTLSLLLGKAGRKVLLLEKAPRLGGSLRRFKRQSVPFDVGFHFTGGFHDSGIMTNMSKVLGIYDKLELIFLEDRENNRFIFEAEQEEYLLPTGLDELVCALQDYFPNERAAIRDYFDGVIRVCQNTALTDLRNLSGAMEHSDEDFVSLQGFLDRITGNVLLKAILSGYSMCYGTRPSEVSFAANARICFSLYESLARVRDGGDAFINAFKEGLAEVGVDIAKKCHIVACEDVRDRRVGRFVLNTGDEVSCESCIFTIHPHEILKTLPRKHLSKAFIDRVNDFEPTCGFFSVYGVVDGPVRQNDFDLAVIAIFPDADVEAQYDIRDDREPFLGISRCSETVEGIEHHILNAFQLSFHEQVAQWRDSKVGKRPAEYYEYKQKSLDLTVDRIRKRFPDYSDGFRALESATMLTYRDYLNTPFGASYGVKQKIGQSNLVGKLPLRNTFASGQSAVLPGLAGAMTSAFLVARGAIGEENYLRLLDGALTTWNEQ